MVLKKKMLFLPLSLFFSMDFLDPEFNTLSIDLEGYFHLMEVRGSQELGK